MYIAVFALLLLFTVSTFMSKKQDFQYYFLFAVLSLALIFRYGQGIDYFSYNYIYKSCTSFYIAIFNPENLHIEFGFRLLYALFNTLHLDFTALIACVSVFEMCMLHRFLKRHCVNPTFSLFLFFPTFYLTYYFSIMRQGIVIAVLLGVMVDHIKARNWKKYIATTVILVLFHSSALVLFIIPIVLRFELKTIYFFSAFAAVIAFVMLNPGMMNVLRNIPMLGEKIYIYVETSPSWLSLMERLVSFSLVCVLFYSSANKDISEGMTDFMKIYALGTVLYIALMPFAIISSRVVVYFKIFEIILLPALLVRKTKMRVIITAAVISIAVVMFYKNIHSYVLQGYYFDNINVWNYPYISVFNKDDIWNYRKISWYIENMPK